MPTVAEQQALFQALVDQGYDRSTAAIAAGNAQFAANPILAALGDPRQRTEAIERFGGDQNAPRVFGLPPLAPEANALTRQTYETLRQLLANPGTPDEEGYDALGRFQQSLVWGTPYSLDDYNDPNVRAFVQNLQYNAGLQDQFSVLGDNLFPALALFGLAAGGAALAGGAGAAGGAGGTAGAGGAAGTAGTATLPAGFTAPAVLSSGVTPAAGLAVGEGLAVGGVGAAGATAPAILGSGTTPAAGVAVGEGGIAAGAGGASTLPAGFTAPAIQGSGTTAAGGLAVGEAGAATLPAGFTAPAIQGSGATPSAGTAVGEGAAGSSLGLKDILKAAPQAAGLVNAAGSLINGETTTGEADPETEALYQQLRELAARSVPQAQGLAQGGDATLRQRASGSSAAILRQIAPQVRQIREQLERTFHGLGQRFGQQGQYQAQREQGKSLGQAGEALQRLMAQAQTGGVQGRLDFLSNLRPALLTQLPNLQAPTTTPVDFAQVGAGLSQSATLFDTLFNRPTTPVTPQTTTAATSGAASGAPFFTPSSFAMLGSDIE